MIQKQRLFPLAGEARGVARVTALGEGAAVTLTLNGVALREDMALWLVCDKAELLCCKLDGIDASGAMTATAPMRALEARAAVLTRQGKPVSHAFGSLNRREADMALMKIRLAAQSDKPQKEPAGAFAPSQIVREDTAARAPQEASAKGKDAPGIPEAVTPAPKSRVAASIVSEANRLFFPSGDDYDEAAFACREPFRPRPVEGSLPVPPAPCEKAEQPAEQTDNAVRQCREQGQRRVNRTGCNRRGGCAKQQSRMRDTRY